jgi:tetratricopeptide (TPR) repeat protein
VSPVARWFYERVATWMMIFRQSAIAREYWQKILAASPNDTKILAMLAHQDAQEGKVESAMAIYERLTALAPDDKVTWFNYGFLLQGQKHHREAIKAFEKTLRIDPKLDRAWFGQGLSHVALQELDDAIECFKKTNKLQPLSPHGFYELAKAQHAKGDTDGCEKTMRRIKDFDPKVTAQLEDETGIRVGVERWWTKK